MFDIALSDLPTIGLLVLLEGLLSADNALVMAILVMGLPRSQQSRALRYGLVAAFAFRFIAVLLAAVLIRAAWVKLLGGVYLLYLAVQHFRHGDAGESGRPIAPAKPMWGLPAFWATIVRVELINIAFSIDSILVAVALSPKTRGRRHRRHPRHHRHARRGGEVDCRDPPVSRPSWMGLSSSSRGSASSCWWSMRTRSTGSAGKCRGTSRSS